MYEIFIKAQGIHHFRLLIIHTYMYICMYYIFFMLKINLQFILALYENAFADIILFVDIIFLSCII